MEIREIIVLFILILIAGFSIGMNIFNNQEISDLNIAIEQKQINCDADYLAMEKNILEHEGLLNACIQDLTECKKPEPLIKIVYNKTFNCFIPGNSDYILWCDGDKFFACKGKIVSYKDYMNCNCPAYDLECNTK